jgi:hypothetical protein
MLVVAVRVGDLMHRESSQARECTNKDQECDPAGNVPDPRRGKVNRVLELRRKGSLPARGPHVWTRHSQYADQDTHHHEEKSAKEGRHGDRTLPTVKSQVDNTTARSTTLIFVASIPNNGDDEERSDHPKDVRDSDH